VRVRKRAANDCQPHEKSDNANCKLTRNYCHYLIFALHTIVTERRPAYFTIDLGGIGSSGHARRTKTVRLSNRCYASW
jgi:hypothetical protein